MHTPIWVWFGGIGLVAFAAFLLAGGSDAGRLAFAGAGLAAALAAFAGARRAGPAAIPLRLLGGALAAFGVGGVLFDRAIAVGDAPPIPSWADAWYLLGYPLFGGAMLGVSRLRERRQDPAAWIDAVVVALGAMPLVWVFLLDPHLTAPGLPPAERLVLAAYPAADLVLFALFARLLLGGRWRNRVEAGFVGGIAALLAADVLFGLARPHPDWVPIGLPNALFLLAFVALGAVALHPGFVPSLQPGGVSAPLLSRGRIAMLAVAAAIGPTLIAAEALGPLDVDDVVVAVTSATITMLAIARVASMGLRLEQALARSQENEDRLRRALAAANMATWDWDVRTDRVIRSEEMPRLYGMEPSPEDDAPDRFFVAVHADDQASILAADLDFERHGGPYAAEYRVVWPTGEIRWLRERGDAEVGADGLPVRLRGVTQDVTAGKRAELALAAAESRWKALVEEIPAIVYTHAPTGLHEATYVSPAVRSMLGYEPEEVLRNPGFVASLVHPDDRASLESASAEAAAAGRLAVEYRARARGGRWVWVRDSSVLIRDDAGAALHWQGIITDVSSLKQAEAALRDNEASQRALLEALPDMVFRLDRTGTYLDARSDRLGTMAPPDTIVGRTIAEVLPMSVAVPLAVAVQEAIETGETRTVEYDLDTAIGSRHFEARMVAAPAAEVVAVVRDITDRVVAEQQRRAAEALYRTLVEQLPAVVALNADDEINSTLYVGPQSERILGYPPEYYLANPGAWLEQVHPEDRDRVGASIGSADGSDHPPPIEFRIIKPDGRTVWLREESVLIRDERGSPRYWQTIQLDITGGKQAEATLLLRDLAIAATSDGIFITDPTRPGNPIVDVNPAFERITGYRAAEVLGRDGRLLQGPATDRDTAAKIDEAIAGGDEFAVTVLNYRKDGTTFWNDLRIAAIRDEAGEPAHFVAAIADASERVAAADALRAARDAAEGANRLKSEFLSTMSHELRTPMNAIIGYAHLLLDGMAGPLLPTQEADVRQITASADRLLALIDDVLDLSRIEAGRFEIAREPVDLAALVEQVRADVAPMAAAKGLTLALALSPGLPEVIGDAARLRQVVLNLAGNAVKFTERGRVAIAVTGGSGEVRIAVEDTGIGVPEGALNHVFDEFRQADGSTSRRYGGSGLGLAIARRLAELHGGRIEARSVVGEGSRFTLVLPTAGRGGGSALSAIDSRDAYLCGSVATHESEPHGSGVSA